MLAGAAGAVVRHHVSAHVAVRRGGGGRVVVLHGHPVSAAYPAAQQSGQQRGPVARRPGRVGDLPVRGHPCDVRLVARRRDVRRHPIGQSDEPFVLAAHHPPGARASRDLLTGLHPAPPVGVVARVDRIVQHDLQGFPVRATPLQLALLRPRTRPHRHLNLMLHQVAQHCVEGAEPVEGVEDQAHDTTGLLIGVEHDLPGSAPRIADRQLDGQFAALGLGQPTRRHPLLDQVELCLAHRSLEPQQQPVVVERRVVHAVGIGQQAPGQAAQLQQLVPVPAGARQSGHLDPQHEPDTTHRHLRDELLEARPGIGHRSRAPQIIIDHHHPRACPSQRHRPLHQPVLQPSGLLMLHDLLFRRLADIHDRRQIPVLRPDLPLTRSPRPIRRHAHRDPPPSRPTRLSPPARPTAGPPPPSARPAGPPRSGPGGLGTLRGHPGPPPISLSGEHNRWTRPTSRNNASRLITTRESDDPPDSGASCVAH